MMIASENKILRVQCPYVVNSFNSIAKYIYKDSLRSCKTSFTNIHI